jgi:hypothetical protein
MKKNKPRSIKKLLRVMLSNQRLFETGLCNWTTSLADSNLITRQEMTILKSYMNKNDPSLFSTSIISPYWFPKGEIQPRLDWINYHLQPTWLRKIKDLYTKLFM